MMYGKKPAAKPAMPAQAAGGMARKPATPAAGKPAAMPAQAQKGMAKRPTGRGM
jgi:hypothetical protein